VQPAARVGGARWTTWCWQHVVSGGRLHISLCKHVFAVYGGVMERQVPDVTQLKALARPVRLRIRGLLRTLGPATASQIARRLGVNSGATSYHLRQLAEHGFIEEAPDLGTRRERWWRAVSQVTSVPE